MVKYIPGDKENGKLEKVLHVGNKIELSRFTFTHLYFFYAKPNQSFNPMYILSYNFIAPSWRNDAHNKCNLRIKPKNLDPVP